MVIKKTLVVIALSALLMLCFEAVKETCFGGLSKWESHIITVILSSLFSGLAAFLVLKRLSLLITRLEREIECRKRAEEEANSQLRKNELLIREVHHRIKNNMALIESMLHIKMESGIESSANHVISETINRLRSTRMMYEKLLLSEDFLEVATKRYLEELVEIILDTYSDKRRIIAEFEIEDVKMDAEDLLRLGILTNEVVTNSIKHGFKDKDGGTVRISLQRNNGDIRYIVEDDGSGLPAGLDFEKAGGFGLMIIKLLTEQLNGTVRVESAAGTRYVFVFRGKDR